MSDVQDIPSYRKARLRSIADTLGMRGHVAAIDARNRQQLPWTEDFVRPLSDAICARLDQSKAGGS